ncbi:MAG: DUF1848 domain-containing protein [Candidatus Omnitrophota bacterium]
MQIISASRRTDIPAFYSEWFMNRIRAGFCRVRNPLYPQQQTHPVSLAPNDVECIVFWTRNPGPLIAHLDELDSLGFTYYFLFTVIGYPRLYDPASPDLDRSLNLFEKLSARLGPERVIWRYDPIILTNKTPVEWHQERMSLIAGRLQGLTKRMVFSFLIDYPHAKERYKKVCQHGVVFNDKLYIFEQRGMAEWIGINLLKSGISPGVCADSRDFPNIEKSSCIDRMLINQLTGNRKQYRKDPAQRTHCRCAAARDIGANDSCLARCFYCYATKDFEKARKNYERHDPTGEYLVCL